LIHTYKFLKLQKGVTKGATYIDVTPYLCNTYHFLFSFVKLFFYQNSASLSKDAAKLLQISHLRVSDF